PTGDLVGPEPVFALAERRHALGAGGRAEVDELRPQPRRDRPGCDAGAVEGDEGHGRQDTSDGRPAEAAPRAWPDVRRSGRVPGKAGGGPWRGPRGGGSIPRGEGWSSRGSPPIRSLSPGRGSTRRSRRRCPSRTR